MITMRLSRWFIWGILAAVAATIFVPFALMFFPVRCIEPWQSIGTGLILTTAFSVAFGCAAVRENGRSPRLMFAALLLLAVATVNWCLVIWFVDSLGDYDVIELWTAISIDLSIIPCTLLTIGVLSLPLSPTVWWSWLRRTTVALVLVLALFLMLAILCQPNVRDSLEIFGLDASYSSYAVQRKYEETAGRYGSFLTLLAGAALVATCLSLWMSRLLLGPATSGRPGLRYHLTCPRCSCTQFAETGSWHCARCGLKIRLEVT